MKREVYEIVTQNIIDRMDAGHIPWQRPWNGEIGLPRNVAGRSYRGINVWILGAAGYQSPIWLTFNQARNLGGNVKRGEKATPIVFWKMLGRDVERPDGTLEPKLFPMMRYYSVFNLEQTENTGIKADTSSPFAEIKPLEHCEAIVHGYRDKPRIVEQIHSDRPPCYSPSLDLIDMPLRSQFNSIEQFYTALFHEMGHSTGHESRLYRATLTKYACDNGSQNQEELVAEFCSGYLSATAGIMSDALTENKAAYIQSWLKTIKEDRKMLVIAAAQAQKACDYILGVKAGETEKSDEQVAQAA